jgi:hypothetical protein
MRRKAKHDWWPRGLGEGPWRVGPWRGALESGALERGPGEGTRGVSDCSPVAPSRLSGLRPPPTHAPAPAEARCSWRLLRRAAALLQAAHHRREGAGVLGRVRVGYARMEGSARRHAARRSRGCARAWHAPCVCACQCTHTQVEEVERLAKEALSRGQCVVIGLQSTGASGLRCGPRSQVFCLQR